MSNEVMNPVRRRRCTMSEIIVSLFAVTVMALGIVASTPVWAGPVDKKKGGGPIELEEIVIEGRVQKPQAFYILQRSNFGFKVMDLSTEYLEDIKNSVKDEVF